MKKINILVSMYVVCPSTPVYKQFPHLLFCAVIEKSKVNKLPFSGLACVSQSNQQDDTVDMKMGIDHLVIKPNAIKITSG